MTIKSIWVGNRLTAYESNDINPVDGQPIESIRSEGQARFAQVPTHAEHVLRLMDIDREVLRPIVVEVDDIYADAAGVLAQYDESDATRIYIWQAGDDKVVRLAATWVIDTEATVGTNPPYRCPAKGNAGVWVAQGPYILNGGTFFEGNLFPESNGGIIEGVLAGYSLGFDTRRWNAFLYHCSVSRAPVASTDVVRLGDLAALIASGGIQVVVVSDLGTPAATLSAYTGNGTNAKLIMLQATSTADFTLYAWASGSFSAASPYLVAGSSGYWAAIGGRYHYGLMYLQGVLNCAGVTSSGAVAGTTGTFSGALSGASAAISGALSAGGVTTFSGNPAVFAYRSAAQAIPDDTTTTIIFPTESFDVGANYNHTNGIFTAPVAGKYLVCANVYWAYNTTGQRNIGIFVNNVEQKHLQIPALVNGDSIGHTQDISAVVNCDANDTISIRVFQNSDGSLDIMSPVDNPNSNITLSIVKVA